jgi:hypothetical protein
MICITCVSCKDVPGLRKPFDLKDLMICHKNSGNEYFGVVTGDAESGALIVLGAGNWASRTGRGRLQPLKKAHELQVRKVALFHRSITRRR